MLELCFANSWLVFKRKCDLLNKKLTQWFHLPSYIEPSEQASTQIWPAIIQHTSTCKEMLQPKESHNNSQNQVYSTIAWDIGHFVMAACNTITSQFVLGWTYSKCLVFLCLNETHYHQSLCLYYGIGNKIKCTIKWIWNVFYLFSIV